MTRALSIQTRYNCYYLLNGRWFACTALHGHSQTNAKNIDFPIRFCFRSPLIENNPIAHMFSMSKIRRQKNINNSTTMRMFDSIQSQSDDAVFFCSPLLSIDFLRNQRNWIVRIRIGLWTWNETDTYCVMVRRRCTFGWYTTCGARERGMCDAHQFISTNCLFCAEIIGIMSEWVSAPAMPDRRAWQLCSSLIVTWRITTQISIFINYDWTAEKLAHSHRIASAAATSQVAPKEDYLIFCFEFEWIFYGRRQICARNIRAAYQLLSSYLFSVTSKAQILKCIWRRDDIQYYCRIVC